MISWDEVCRLARGLGGLPVLRCRPGSPAANAGVLVPKAAADARDVLFEILADGGVPTLGGTDPTLS